MRTLIAGVFLVGAVAAFVTIRPIEVRADSRSGIEELIEAVQSSNVKTATAAREGLLALGPVAVPALTQGLWSDSSRTRLACVSLLGQIGPEARSAVPSLIQLLNDNTADVRRDAARALASIGAHSALPALEKALRDESAAVRLAAAESLILLGGKAEAVLPVLMKSLKVARPEEQQIAARLLGELGPEAAPSVLALQGALPAADALLAFRIAEALGRIGPAARNAVPALKKKVKDDPDAVFFRVPVAIALWRIARDPDAGDLLRQSLKGKQLSPQFPYRALWRIDRSRETIDALTERLKAEDESAIYAADVLGSRAKAEIPHLLKAAKNSGVLGGSTKPEVVSLALLWFDALARMGPEGKSVLGMFRAQSLSTPQTRLAAAAAMYQLDPKPDNAMAIAEFLEKKDERLRAAEVLKQLQPSGKAVAIELLAAVESTDDEFRLAAASALWRLEKNPAALKAAVKSLRSADPRVRAQAALELGAEFGPDAKTAVPDLVKRLFDSHSSVRSTAAEALGRIGPAVRDVTPALLALLEGDEPAFVQSAACEALGLVDPADKDAVAAALRQKLEHPDPLVRAHAGLALVRLVGDKSGEEEAVCGLGYRTHHVRITAAESLWLARKDARCVPLLVRALEESNINGQDGENERYMAVRALGRIGADAKPAVPELVRLLDARDPDLAAAARAALKAIDPESAKKAGVK